MKNESKIEVEYLSIPTRENEIMRKKFKLNRIVFFIIIIYGLYMFFMQTADMTKIRAQINSYGHELQKLKEKNQELNDEVKMSKSDTYIEKLAREKLGLIKEGETPVIDKTK